MVIRLTNIDSSTLDSPSRYYNDGFVLLPVIKQEKIVSLLNSLLLEKKLKDQKFYWDNVLNSSSLRPNVFEYDDCFLDFLFDNELPAKLEEHSCRRMTLAHIQVIKTEPGRSYQDWHRDVYQFGLNSWVGNTPPAHKIIFYPVLKDPEPRLKYIRASNRCALNEASMDASLINRFENEVLDSSNDRIFMFDTSMLHGVIPDVNPLGSIRVIYNFISEKQYNEKYSHKDHHRILHDLYEKKMKGT